MRVSFLRRSTTGYFEACTRALAARGHELSVLSGDQHDSIRFEPDESHFERSDLWTESPSEAFVANWLEETRPDVLVVYSWGTTAYLRASMSLRSKNIVRLLAADTPWRRTPKQVGGLLTHRVPLARAFDGAWICGSPQWEMVRRLGFSSEQIIEHMYSCDSTIFQPTTPPSERNRGPFLFLGQMVERKGVHQLREAYARYRRMSPNPRGLRVIGSGPVACNGPGIERLEFVQPTAVPALMDECYALVHPALVEHWGLVLHEASSLGLPLVTTRAVGAASRFLIDGVSGLYSTPDPEDLAQTLLAMDELRGDEYESMSAASLALGRSLTVDDWATNFERRLLLLRSRGATG